MNKIQEQILNNLKQDILLHDGLGEAHVDGYEYKRWEVTEHHVNRTYPKPRTTTYVYLHAIVGRKDDEVSMAAIFCRNRRLLVIGPRGGVKSLLGKKVHGYTRSLIWGYTH